MTGRRAWPTAGAGNIEGVPRVPGVQYAPEQHRGVRRESARPGRAGRRADHRRGTPLQPAPDHPRRRDDRAEAAEERQGAGHRRRRPRQPGPALPRRGRRRHARASPSSTRSTSPTCSARSSTASPTSGSPKAESAEGVDRRDQPATSNVVVHDERLDNDNVMQVFEGYDLIVDGTDNFATRYMVNDAAYFLGIPYVWGSIYRFDGQASRVRADARRRRALLPLPLPRAAAAGHGAALRRGRRARRAVRAHRRRSRSTRRSSC